MQSLRSLKKLREDKRKYIYSLLYVPTYLPFPVFFISFSGYELPCGVISFQPEGLHLVYLVRLTKNSLTIYLEMSLCHPHLWLMLLLDMGFLVDRLLPHPHFYHFEYVHLSSPSIVSGENSAINHNVVCLYITSFFCLAAFKIFSLPSPSPSLSLSHCTCVDILALVTQVSEALLIFLQFFFIFLIFRLDDFYWQMFKFTDSCSFNLLYFSTVEFL